MSDIAVMQSDSLEVRRDESFEVADMQLNNSIQLPFMQQIDEVGEKSVNSDIPDEHMNGMGYNEYIRRYDLNIKA